MPLTTTLVTGYLYDPNGEPLANTQVTLRLTKPERDENVIVPESVTATTDDNGLLSVELWPNTRGVAGSQYRLTIKTFGGAGERKLYDKLLTVADTGTASFVDLFDADAPDVTSTSAAIRAADAAEASALEAQQSANAALGYAQQGLDYVTESAANAAAAFSSADLSADSAAAALLSEQSAEASAAAAAASQSLAAASATQAGTSATSAAASATQAGVSAGQAAASATQAGTSATSAAASATQAGVSAGQAATSASEAAASAAEAQTYLTAVQEAADEAEASAAVAVAAGQNATAQAEFAEQSKDQASVLASQAATSASEAGASAVSASVSANSAYVSQIASQTARDQVLSVLNTAFDSVTIFQTRPEALAAFDTLLDNSVVIILTDADYGGRKTYNKVIPIDAAPLQADFITGTYASGTFQRLLEYIGQESLNRVLTAPLTSASPGFIGDLYFGAGFLDFHDGNQWYKLTGATFP